MLKYFFCDKISIKPKKIKKHFMLNKTKTLTPIKLISKNNDKIIYEKTNSSHNIKKVNNKNKNDEMNIFNSYKKVKNSRNLSYINNLNGLNSDYINITNNENNNSYLTYIKTTMDTNMTKTKTIKENITFINDNSTFIYNTPSTKYESSNVKNKNKRKRIKIPKQNEYFTSLINKTKNINNTFIIPNRLNSLLNVQQKILNPIRQKTKINYKKSISLNKKVNGIKEKINKMTIKKQSIERNNIIITKTKIKNIYKLLENKLESINNKDRTKEEIKKEKRKLELKIEKIRKETNQMNIKASNMKEEMKEDNNRILELKKDIEKIKNDKKKVNAMLVLLHKRIIDIKNRIRKHDEHNLYLDKSFFELNQRFRNLI